MSLWALSLHSNTIRFCDKQVLSVHMIRSKLIKHYFLVGRGVTEVDDVINNTLGGVLGWCGQRALRRKLAKVTRVEK